MEKGKARRTKAKAHPNSQNSSPLQLAVVNVSESSPDQGNLPLSTSTHVDRSKLASKRRKLHKGGASSHNESSSVDEIVPIGAFRVTTRSDPAAQYDEEGADDEIEASGPPTTGSYEHAVVAHVVEESSPGFLEEEKEKIEQETRERLLAELTGQAAQAVAVINEDKEQEEGRSSFLLGGCLCFVLVLIIAITIGVVLSSKTTSSKSADEESTTTSDEEADKPSPMPTLEPRNNTFCNEAHQLVVGQSISGSLDDSIGAFVIFCEYSDGASSALFGTPARWYVYRGEGFPVFAKTDAFVDIHVYLDCDSSCHEEAIYPNWETESIVTWEAETDTDYFIVISVPDEMDQDNNKDFTLTFETNDSLETAYGPLTPGRDSIVGGSTVGTKVATDVPACGSASAPTGPGVWYMVTGNGRIITASTCGSPTGLDTQVSVFSAENMCIDGNDDFCSSKSQVAWSSTEDEIYYILVHGKDGTEGTFILQVMTEGESLAEADLCVNAMSVEVGFTGPVDLSRATADPDLLNCTGASWIVGPTIVGNFYTFIGTGENVRIVLDYSFAAYDMLVPPRLDLLTGSSCNALECISACNGDDLEHYTCQVPSLVGQKYYVYVFYIEEVYMESGFDLNGGLNLTIQAGA